VDGLHAAAGRVGRHSLDRLRVPHSRAGECAGMGALCDEMGEGGVRADICAVQSF
jgi:hypothetical protein